MADSETLKIIIQARDDASKSLKTIERALGRLDDKSEKSSKGIKTLSTSFASLKRSIFSVKGAIIGFAAAFGAFKVASFIKESTLLAARYETLGITLQTVGKRAGYTGAQLANFEKGLQKSGIAGVEARTVLTRMAQAQLDLNQATLLGRVAQDAAVIGGLNSSETMERMLHAVQANSVEILRTIGMNVSFEKSYKKFANTLDIAVSQMTEAQRTQARFNAVLEAGSQIAGSYESAMSTAGKQLLSFKRYVDTFKLAIGKAFTPALAEVVKGATSAMKEFIKAVESETFQQAMTSLGKQLGEEIRSGFLWIIQNKDLIVSAIITIAKAAGIAVKAMTTVLSVFDTKKETAIMQFTSMLRNQKAALETYQKQRAVIVKKIQEDDYGWFENEEKMKNKLEQVDKQIAITQGKITQYQKSLGSLVATPSKKAEPIGLGLYEPDQAVTKAVKEPEKRTALGSTVMASQLARQNTLIEIELAKLKAKLKNNEVALQEYYRRRVELAKKGFESEKRYLEYQISKEPDPDKKLKLQDKLFKLTKQHDVQLLELTQEKIEAEKRLRKEKEQMERMLENARLALINERSSLKEIEDAELARLEQSQADRLKQLKEGNAKEDQIAEANRISQMERENLLLDQEKRTSDKRLEIQRMLASARRELIDPTQDLNAVFRAEMDQLAIQQEERLKTIKEKKLSEQEEIAAIEEAHRISQLEKDKLHNEQRLQVQQMYLEGVKGILTNVNATFGDLYEMSGRKTKEFFYIQKAAAMAQTLMSTYEAAQKAYTSLVGLPVVGPALAAGAAGAAIASGLARVAVIRSQKMAGGGEVKGHSPHAKADNVPIDATAGEFMHPVAAVKKYGKDFMESVRNLSFPVDLARQVKAAGRVYSPRSMRFAEGGLIPSQGSAGAITNSITTNVSVESPLGRRLRDEIEATTIKVLREEMR